MIPVYQERFGTGDGDCLRAAVASVFELPLEGVPDFAARETQWFQAIYEWCAARGVGVLQFRDDQLPGIIANCYGIAGVRVSESEETHAVVTHYTIREITEEGRFYWQGEVIHDPNPKGLTITEVIEHIVFIPIRPVTPNA